jgi:hypothetical protein
MPSRRSARAWLGAWDSSREPRRRAVPAAAVLVSWGVFGWLHALNQACPMQAPRVWFPGPPLGQAARMQKVPFGQALEERGNLPFSWSQAPLVQARAYMSVRMEERADTRNYFYARCANRTVYEPGLYACVRKPIEQLSHLASLATAGLYAACEPGCGHPRTKRALGFWQLLQGLHCAYCDFVEHGCCALERGFFFSRTQARQGRKGQGHRRRI